MPEPKQMEAAVQAYFEGFRKHDLDIIIALFADNATAEDPVGTPRHEGIEAVRAFYAQSIATGAVLEQQGPTRIADAYAAFAFHAVVPGMGHVEVIDTFRFNEAGKVIEMRAFFGPGNVKMGA